MEALPPPFPERLARIAAQQQAELSRLAQVHRAAWEDALRGDFDDRTAPSDNYTLAVDVRGDAEGIDGQFKEGSGIVEGAGRSVLQKRSDAQSSGEEGGVESR
ncbi:unnamed protein product [Symbiodinium natans]|uniref:Uncharacterized protein n=1 Tax=Symbiodinium natans TaxID=878477 RepID=A0A812JXR3_9DINO|nr:unnamed protein product [Symbiodinium natans]